MNEIVSRIAVKVEQKHFLRPEKPEAFLYKALIYAVLASFVRQCSVIDTAEPEYDVYRKAMVYITKHYTGDISLKKVAVACGITPAHLSRVLNSHGKYSFSDIVSSLRVYEAKRMLTQTQLSVSQIALEAGFGTIRNFNRVFQKYFLCSPRQLRDGNK